MKINRIINGKTYAFELNPQELYDAFVEQEHKWDLSDVDAHVGHHYSDDEVDSIAWEMRRQRNKYDLDFHSALDEAIRILGLDEQEEAS